MTAQVQPEDFDVAKAVFDQLKDLSPERQRRILGWITDALGVPAAPTPASKASARSTTTDPPAPDQPPQSTTPGTATDIKSFVAAKAPKSDTQFAATVAYYYRFEAPPAERRDNISAEVLQEATRLAGRARLASPKNTLNNAKAAGYLDSPARGEFTVNSVGENLVAMTLPGAGSESSPSRRTPRKRTPKKASTKAAKKTVKKTSKKAAKKKSATRKPKR